MLEIHKMVARLRLQRDAMDRTLRAIEDLAQGGLRRNVHGTNRGIRTTKKWDDTPPGSIVAASLDESRAILADLHCQWSDAK